MSVSTIDRPVSALRQRMLDDMAMRGLRSDTQRDYIRVVRSFAAFLGRSPDTATAEDIRRFQVHQRDSGVQPPTINCSVSARPVAAPGPGALPAQAASGADCPGSRPAARSSTGPQIQGHTRHRLWRGPARVRSGQPQGR